MPLLPKKHMSRRDFISQGGALALALSAGVASGSTEGSGGPARQAIVPKPGPGAAKSRVVLIHAMDRTDGVKRCLELAKVGSVSGKNVLVKPNFNTSDETPGSTHNDTLQTILAWARKNGAKSLAVGDRSGPEPMDQVLKRKKIPELAALYDAKVINFDGLKADGYVKVTPPGSHWKDGFLAARPVVETEYVISTCCLKTHQYGGIFSMSLKNSVGIVPRGDFGYMRELHSSPDQRKMIAEINYAYKPALVILDGLEAFVDAGPMTGPRKTANVFLAGTDRVAIDAVGLAVLMHLGSNKAIMLTPIFAQEQIARAAELGLGAASGADIVIETGDKASEEYAEKIRGFLG